MSDLIKASKSPVDRARAASFQSRPSGTAPVRLYGSPLFALGGMDSGGIVNPWWSTTRDRQLREFWPQSDHLSGALNTFVTKVSTIPWRIEARDKSVRSHVRMAAKVEDMLRLASNYGEQAGFHTSISKFTMDLITQDNGGFIEVVGDGPVDGALKGSPFAINHLDAGNCQRTGDIVYPVLFTDLDGKMHKIHYTRVVFTSQMTSPIESMFGVGFCAVSRCINVAQNLIDIAVFKQEKMGSRPKREILVTKGGLTPEMIEAAVQRADAYMDSVGMSRYSKPVIVGDEDALDAGIERVSINSIPEGFDENQSTTLAMATISLALGVDARELFPAMSIGSTKADALISHLKQRTKGIGHLLEELENLFNFKLLPKSLKFVFDFQDDAQDKQVAEIRSIYSGNRASNLESEITDERVERENMLDRGELSLAQFVYLELESGRLEDGTDAVALFFDDEYSEFLDLEKGLDEYEARREKADAKDKPDKNVEKAKPDENVTAVPSSDGTIPGEEPEDTFVDWDDPLNVLENNSEKILLAVQVMEDQAIAAMVNVPSMRQRFVRESLSALRALRRLYDDPEAKPGDQEIPTQPGQPMPDQPQSEVDPNFDNVQADPKDMDQKPLEKGGAGSGHWGHSGRPGFVGGSASSNIGRWNGRSELFKSELKAFTKKYHDAETEHAIGLTSSGTVLFENHGEAHSVGFSDDDLSRMREAMTTGEKVSVIHNHPGGDTLSVQDSIFMFANGFSEIIAIGSDTTYSLENKMAPREMDGLDLKFLSLNVNRARKATLNKLYSRLTGRTSDDRGERIIMHVAWEAYARANKKSVSYSWDETDQLLQKGGPGSGHFGHAGRPDKVGGSVPSEGSSIRTLGAQFIEGFGGMREGFQIRTHEGSRASGYLYNADFPGESSDPKMGELFYVEVPPDSRRRGIGISLALDALHMMTSYGSERVVMDAVTPEGESLINALIRNGYIKGPVADTGAGKKKYEITVDLEKGGPGSGHFDHVGRPGEIGGSITSSMQGYRATRARVRPLLLAGTLKKENIRDSYPVKQTMEDEVGALLSEGLISKEYAEELGFQDAENYIELPEKLWHVTTAKEAVMMEGLKTRNEMEMRDAFELGGGPSNTISFADNRETADAIYHGIIEARKVARGEIGVQDMINMAAKGEGAPVPFIGDFYEFWGGDKWLGDNGIPEPLNLLMAGQAGVRETMGTTEANFNSHDHRHNNWYGIDDPIVRANGEKIYRDFRRDLSSEELQGGVFEVYKRFTSMREHAGGFYDPLFFGSDVQGLANTSLSDIAIVEVTGTGYGHQESAMGEYRTNSGNAVEIDGVVDPGERIMTKEISGYVRGRVRTILTGKIHESFTVAADQLFQRGYMTEDERIKLSSAIGQVLPVFNEAIDSEVADRSVDVLDLRDVANKSTLYSKTTEIFKHIFRRGKK